jgi:predicted negative regulator of RcsB-dependent stress response
MILHFDAVRSRFKCLSLVILGTLSAIMWASLRATQIAQNYLATFKFVTALGSLQRRRRTAAQRQVRAMCGTFQGSLYTEL